MCDKSDEVRTLKFTLSLFFINGQHGILTFLSCVTFTIKNI